MEYTNFRKTDDKNIVLADGVSADQELYVSKIKEQIAGLQFQIDAIPEPISTGTIADERVLELIEDYNAMLPTVAGLEAEKEKKEALLFKCLNIKG